MYHGAKSSALTEKHGFQATLGSGNKHSCKVWVLNNNVSQCGSLTIRDPVLVSQTWAKTCLSPLGCFWALFWSQLWKQSNSRPGRAAEMLIRESCGR